MSHQLKRIKAKFYHLPSGREPVRDWLKSLSGEDRRTVGYDIALLEWGWPIGMPLCRPLKNGLWEVRSNLQDGQIARVLFCATSGNLILLHAFIKKSQKTPDAELALARKRKKEIE
jgi:phage-related protein